MQPEKKYSFIVFAGNDYAIGQSEPMSFVIPIRQSLEPPCDTKDNLVQVGENHEITNSFGRETATGYKITANAPRMDMVLNFSDTPTTGIYTTADTEIKNTEVRVEITFGQWNIVEGNHQVYIEKIDSEKFKVSFCNLIWWFNGNKVTVNGSFLVN